MNDLLDKIQSFSKTLNSLSVSLVALASFGFVFTVIAKPPPVIIEQIHIPSIMEEKGIKSEIVVVRILDQVQKLRAAAKIDRAESAAFGLLATKPDAQIDASIGGLSVKSVEQIISVVFDKKPKKISGDIINIGTSDKVVLQAKLRHGNDVISSREMLVEDKGIDQLINEMAFDLYRHFEPFRASLAAYRLRKTDDAREALRPVLASGDAQDRKYALWLQSFIVSAQQKELDLLEAIKIDPKFVPALVSLAGLERDRQNFELSHQFADQAISADPKSPMGYHEKGRTYRAEQKISDAKSAFLKACSASSDFAPCHNQMGELFLMEADDSKSPQVALREAANEFNLNIKKDHLSVWGYSNAAYAALRLGNIKEAQLLIRRAMELDPELPANVIRNAGILNRSNEKERAKELIQTMIKKHPNWEQSPPPGWGNRAIIRDLLKG
jgi:Tfp pilus assembly protein PilF